MVSILSQLFRKIADDLDCGNSNIDANGCLKILQAIDLLLEGDLEFSKIEAAEYLGISRATFDNYIRDGFLPKGKKHEGIRALFWHKSDLITFK